MDTLCGQPIFGKEIGAVDQDGEDRGPDPSSRSSETWGLGYLPGTTYYYYKSYMNYGIRVIRTPGGSLRFGSYVPACVERLKPAASPGALSPSS